MKTRITEMFGIEHPIILAAMAWVSNGEMVGAVSKAGALGVLGPNAGARAVTKDVQETGERLREQIKQVRAITDRPFAVNFVVGAAGLDKAFSERCVEVGLEEEVPVAVVSQGNPYTHTERLKKAGMKVIHVCATVRHAIKAEEAGVDAVVVSGTEGGGHSGFDQNTTFCLVPQVASALKIPVVAGGGIADGRQLVAALALGAEAVYIGTRFIASLESPAHENFKRAILESQDGDTVAIRHGKLGTAGTGSAGFTDERRGSVRILLNDRLRQKLFRHNGLVDYETLVKYAKPVHEYLGSSRTAASLIHGDSEVGFFFAGQGVGLIHEIMSCEELIRQIMTEAEIAQERIGTF
jgi:NAD(P)H-dependent flavin oxidoreductase YrpB (nitropropane dioxygenase family)